MAAKKASATEYDANEEFSAAIKALSEAAWRMRVASYALEERYYAQASAVYAAEVLEDLGASIAVADLLAAQIDAIGTQTRKLRKRAKSL